MIDSIKITGTYTKRADRRSVFCRTSSKGNLAFLNTIAGIFEFEANLEEGTAEGKVWEWK